MVKQINKDEFEAEVVQGGGKALVDFWASWCGPCQMLSPVLEEVSNEVDDIRFYGINADEAEELIMKYGISSIPCVILFENGEEAKRRVGFGPKPVILSFLGK